MFKWLALLALVYQDPHLSVEIPRDLLVPSAAPILVEKMAGGKGDDFATAYRHSDADNEAHTLKCRIVFNTQSVIWQDDRHAKSREDRKRMDFLAPLREGPHRHWAPRLFLLAHEVSHCFETTSPGFDTEALNRAWLEAFADAHAALVLKKMGVPSEQLNQVAMQREAGRGLAGRLWAETIHAAASADTTGKTDEELIRKAKSLRAAVFAKEGLALKGG